MKTLSMYNLSFPVIRPAAGLKNMPWIHRLKAKHKQQKEPAYLNNKPFSKSSK